ncbi:MAG: hypothetical protein HY011_11755 [Acidobacteria bacterium]|nr:hypothetical protein [Acidobacteriota bacterium]
MTEPHGSKSPHSETPGENRLVGEVLRVSALRARELEQMYALLARYFAGPTRQQFESDLAEKEWAIILRDALTERVRGFSTLMRLQATLDAQPVVAFFSGDTIIQREYWGETALPRLWSRHVFSLAEQIPAARAYWFLISSGYKTYRYLPLFFRAFYPNYQQPTPPPLKGLLDQLGQQKFGAQYDATGGVIRFNQSAPLQPGVAELTPQRLQDPHVAFFAQANPGHARGDELACLTELTRANLTPAGARMVGG